eukprot:10506441-Karenia_brevis.AAC.1
MIDAASRDSVAAELSSILQALTYLYDYGWGKGQGSMPLFYDCEPAVLIAFGRGYVEGDKLSLIHI